MRAVGLAFLFAVSSAAQTADPAYAALDQAYERARARDFDAAVAAFREAARLSPGRVDIRKNLAYALLKIGETERARDEFAEALRLDPAELHVALEFAFLANETGRAREARLEFDRVRNAVNAPPALRATAEQAFQNVDRPLAEGIARWREALQRTPGNFSAHEELARLAERRNEWSLAAEHFEAAWRIRPGERRLLVDLGRAWGASGRAVQSMSALLAASRGAEPRAAESARQLLPARYPYVYEFRAAMALDPDNIALRRELAYLWLEMDRKAEAESEFRAIVKDSPGDLLSLAQLAFLMLKRGEVDAAQAMLDKVLADATVDEALADRVRDALRKPKALRRRSEEPATQRDALAEARDLAEKSYQAGYLKDALKYLTVVHENDPLDYGVMLKLGHTTNMLAKDRQALDWFKLAGYSPDPSVAGEAQRAYRNLQPDFQRFRTTTWAMPFFSSRWRNGFSYGQVKTEIKASRSVRPYLSMRFVGDARGSTGPSYSQYLSETAFIFGAGMASPVYRGLMAWGEAGVAVSYLRRTDRPGRARPDYRGGLSFTRARGRLLGAEKPGAFWENHEDAVFVSRFHNSLLLYTQNKIGYTRGNVQVYWNANLTGDARRQYWANFAEAGPGVRFRWSGLPPAMAVSLDLVRGFYTIDEGNPRRPNYWDVRAGIWYAFTR